VKLSLTVKESNWGEFLDGLSDSITSSLSAFERSVRGEAKQNSLYAQYVAKVKENFAMRGGVFGKSWPKLADSTMKRRYAALGLRARDVTVQEDYNDPESDTYYERPMRGRISTRHMTVWWPTLNAQSRIKALIDQPLVLSWTLFENATSPAVHRQTSGSKRTFRFAVTDDDNLFSVHQFGSPSAGVPARHMWPTDTAKAKFNFLAGAKLTELLDDWQEKLYQKYYGDKGG
jgi:hypothetical protein